ncbi:MAG: penicillin-binding protein 2 [Microbacterium sp.]
MKSRSARVTARRRTVVALAAVVVIVGAFTVRLLDIQVVHAQENLDNRAALTGITTTQPLYGTRGTITDTNGVVLASSTRSYTAKFDPMNVKDLDITNEDGSKTTLTWDDAAEKIGAIVGTSTTAVQKIVQDALDSNPESRYAQLATGLSAQQYRDLLALGLPYLAFESEQSRAYPNGAVAGNLLGFITQDGTESGLEAAEDACLASSDGSLTYQRGAGGLMIPGTEETTAAVDGGTVKTTIDSDLQFYMQQMIAEETQTQQAQHGNVLVVDVKTGAVRAAAEYPTVDPNDYSATDADDRGSHIFTDTFEPGSTFKALTAAALLDSGSVDLDTDHVVASSSEEFANGAVLGDSFVHGDYDYTLTGVLIDSSNVGISKFADMMDDSTRYDYLEKFGVGQTTDIDFPGEATGLLYPSDQWDAQTHYATAFGQGLTVTMPQVVGAYQALANGGVKEPLHIVESCTDADGNVTTPELSEPTRVVSEDTANTVIEMLENVYTQGSNHDAVAVDGYRIGIKTGTAQKPDGNGGYKDGVYYTSMMSVFPADDPQYIVMVTLDEPTRVTSSAANASAMHKAIQQVLKTYAIEPSDEPAPELPKYHE